MRNCGARARAPACRRRAAAASRRSQPPPPVAVRASRPARRRPRPRSQRADHSPHRYCARRRLCLLGARRARCYLLAATRSRRTASEVLRRAAAPRAALLCVCCRCRLITARAGWSRWRRRACRRVAAPPARWPAAQPGSRGHRIALAAPRSLPHRSAIGLAGATADYLDVLVPAVLRSFGDQDARVRYYACEVGVAAAAARAAAVPARRRQRPPAHARALPPHAPSPSSSSSPVAVQHRQGRARRRAALLRRHFCGRVRAGGGL